MILSKDSKSLYTCDFGGVVKIWSFDDHDFSLNSVFSISNSSSITSLTVTESGYLFIADALGSLKQINIEDQKIEWDFFYIHDTSIITMVLWNESSIFTCDNKGFIKNWNVKDQCVHSNVDADHKGSIISVAL